MNYADCANNRWIVDLIYFNVESVQLHLSVAFRVELFIYRYRVWFLTCVHCRKRDYIRGNIHTVLINLDCGREVWVITKRNVIIGKAYSHIRVPLKVFGSRNVTVTVCNVTLSTQPMVATIAHTSYVWCVIKFYKLTYSLTYLLTHSTTLSYLLV